MDVRAPALEILQFGHGQSNPTYLIKVLDRTQSRSTWCCPLRPVHVFGQTVVAALSLCIRNVLPACTAVHIISGVQY